jgi:predicted ATPase
MRMVGREREFALLVEMLGRAEVGTGGFAVLTGEAGIGKTRLVTEWAAEARRRGFVVLMGRAIESGGSLRPVAQALMEAVRDRTLLEAADLRPFRAALSRVLPGIAAEEPVASIIDPTVVLGEGVLRLLRSVGGSGTLLLLEDLHWADPDTMALLDSLGGALSASPIIVAATVRDDSPGSWAARDLLGYRVRSRSVWASSVTQTPRSWSSSGVLIWPRPSVSY